MKTALELYGYEPIYGIDEFTEQKAEILIAQFYIAKAMGITFPEHRDGIVDADTEFDVFVSMEWEHHVGRAEEHIAYVEACLDEAFPF